MSRQPVEVTELNHNFKTVSTEECISHTKNQYHCAPALR